jgi:hypothetical protein
MSALLVPKTSAENYSTSQVWLRGLSKAGCLGQCWHDTALPVSLAYLECKPGQVLHILGEGG